MDDSKVRNALIAAAKEFLTASTTIETSSGSVTDLPSLNEEKVAWENQNFESEIGVWAAVFYVPNQPQGRTVGQGGFNQLTGFLQIDINVATGSGETDLVPWERKNSLYFHTGRKFEYDGQSVIIVSAGMGAGRHVDNFYRKSITVEFRSQIKRAKVV